MDYFCKSILNTNQKHNLYFNLPTDNHNNVNLFKTTYYIHF